MWNKSNNTIKTNKYSLFFFLIERILTSRQLCKNQTWIILPQPKRLTPHCCIVYGCLKGLDKRRAIGWKTLGGGRETQTQNAARNIENENEISKGICFSSQLRQFRMITSSIYIISICTRQILSFKWIIEPKMNNTKYGFINF